jgi:hypothetical protein
MPRPKKRTDEICILLEVATGNLSEALNISQPVTVKRIEQAIQRHPDLRHLLTPILEEMRDRQRLVINAKAAISTAKVFVKKDDL